MQSDSLESSRVFRTAASVWICYLVSLVMMDILIYSGRPMQPVLWYYVINGAPAFAFMGLSYSSLIKKQVRIMTPVMILLISITPILLGYALDLRLPAAPLANVEGMVLRQLPVLFVGLTLVAWRYKLRTILLYSLVTYAFEMAIVNFIVQLAERQVVLYYVLTIRTITLVVVGIFINQLIIRLRSQQEALKSANNELAHYASTREFLAISRERNRLARELHDTVAHTLSGLVVQLETVKAYWDVDPQSAYKLLEQSLNATRSGLQETRRALKALRASPLDDLGLLLALNNLSEEAAKRGRLELELVLPEQVPSLSPDVEQCIYRIAQEAIENVVNHANAKNLSVRLIVQNAQVLLVIKDDGMGANLAQSKQAGHFGLSGMLERAEIVGGVLTISSQPGQGTCLQLKIKG